MSKRALRSSEEQHASRFPWRFWCFIVLVLAIFAYLIFGLYRLQISKGEEYAATAASSAVKNIVIKGTRGMITDCDGVILARSEETYNVTFYRTTADKNYGELTRSILNTIDIIESGGNSLSITWPLMRNEETGLMEYNWGTIGSISEATWNYRIKTFLGNHYISYTYADGKYIFPDPMEVYKKLRTRYIRTWDPQKNAYVKIYDENNVLIEDYKDCDEAKLSEETVLKVIAVYSEMQMNIFNSRPVTIAKDVSFAVVSEIQGRSMVLTGMDVEVGEKRIYPKQTLASNIIGYTGPISDYETYYSTMEAQGYALTDRIGKDGIEKTMESWLTACITERQGLKVMEKNSVGSLTNLVSYTEPADGNTIRLTISAAYQQAAENAIAKNVLTIRQTQEDKMADPKWQETNKIKIEKRDWETYPIQLATSGVLAVMDIHNGTVLALAQYPTFDLNAMEQGGKAAQEILLDSRNVLLNRATQTRAEPGSIFKMVTGLAALTNGFLTLDETISDEGPFMVYTKLESEAPTCWTGNIQLHQDQTIIQGLEHSCNYFFYTLGSRMYGGKEGLYADQQYLYKYAAQMGLTSKTGIDLPGELRSLVGNQTNLYDSTVALSEQACDTPIIVAASIKKHLRNYGASYGLTYDSDRLDACVRRLMNMALITASDDWVVQARYICMEELGMDRSMVMQAALMSDLWVYLNDIKWGGSQEIQMGIGQSITLLTPVAVLRYLAALGNGGMVWDLQIVDSIISPDGEVLSRRSATLRNQLTGEHLDEYLYAIKQGMKGVVGDDSGTATKYVRDWKYKDEIWAKTGTSQVTIGGVKIDLENNAWFICLASYENPQIAVVSFIPNGYSGGMCSVAAREFLTWWFEEQEKLDDSLDLPAGNQLTP
ncbi:MAG: hypothetical protein CW338_10470 [Clostridiales bacterium]|nr:hypothetical protein [Clostridiales bacterium]